MPPPYRGVLFDLFGTLVHFDLERLPTLVFDGVERRSTVGALTTALRQWVPETTPEAFARALFAVSEEMARARAWDHVELPSRERFRRALERVGCDDGHLMEAAIDLSRRHLAQIAGATTFPAAHATLLAGLRGRLRLGLVSNFDDTAAGYDILLRHGIADAFDTIVVSEALGRRKPDPAVLRAGLRGLDLAAHEVLFVGDTFSEDVAGALAAGIDVAWIDAAGQGVPPDGPAPRYVIRALPEVAALATGLA